MPDVAAGACAQVMIGVAGSMHTYCCDLWRSLAQPNAAPDAISINKFTDRRKEQDV